MMEVGNHWKMRMRQLLQPQIVSYQSCSHMFQCIQTFLHIFTKEQCFIDTHYHLHLSICTHTHIQKHYHLQTYTIICTHSYTYYCLHLHTSAHTTKPSAHTHTHTHYHLHTHTHTPHTQPTIHTHALNAYVAITFYLWSQVNKVPTNMPDSLQN